jgi:colicin import membrane protein
MNVRGKIVCLRKANMGVNCFGTLLETGMTMIRWIVTAAMLLLCIAGAHAQVPAADSKAAVAAEIAAADAKVQTVRIELKRNHRALEAARKTGNRSRIAKANTAVRSSQNQLRSSQLKRDAAREKLAALEGPEKKAAKVRGAQLRTERALRKSARAQAKTERKATAQKAQQAHQQQKAEREAEKGRLRAERKAAQKHGDEIRAARAERRKLNDAEREQKNSPTARSRA